MWDLRFAYTGVTDEDDLDVSQSINMCKAVECSYCVSTHLEEIVVVAVRAVGLQDGWSNISQRRARAAAKTSNAAHLSPMVNVMRLRELRVVLLLLEIEGVERIARCRHGC